MTTTTPVHVRAWYVVALDGPTTRAACAWRLGVPEWTATRALEELVRVGRLERVVGPDGPLGEGKGRRPYCYRVKPGPGARPGAADPREAFSPLRDAVVWDPAALDELLSGLDDGEGDA